MDPFISARAAWSLFLSVCKYASGVTRARAPLNASPTARLLSTDFGGARAAFRVGAFNSRSCLRNAREQLRGRMRRISRFLPNDRESLLRTCDKVALAATIRIPDSRFKRQFAQKRTPSQSAISPRASCFARAP